MPDPKIGHFCDFYPDRFWLILIWKLPQAPKIGEFYLENGSGLSIILKISPAARKTDPGVYMSFLCDYETQFPQ
jgi:hypothetical protein